MNSRQKLLVQANPITGNAAARTRERVLDQRLLRLEEGDHAYEAWVSAKHSLFEGVQMAIYAVHGAVAGSSLQDVAQVDDNDPNELEYIRRKRAILEQRFFADLDDSFW